MNFRSDSLFKRLTEQQRDDLMIYMHSLSKGDIFAQGMELVKSWDVKCSRTAVHDFFKRYAFGWRLERAAAGAALLHDTQTFDAELNIVNRKKLFALMMEEDTDPKFHIMIRALELDQKKLEQKAEVLEHNKEKFRESLRSKLEAGMNALFDQIKDNPQALEAFETMKAAIAK